MLAPKITASVRRGTSQSQRSDLMRDMHKAGLRLDDSAVAADIAVRALRADRDRIIVAARALNLSMRKIASALDVDVAIVHRVLTRGANQSTPIVVTLPS